MYYRLTNASGMHHKVRIREPGADDKWGRMVKLPHQVPVAVPYLPAGLSSKGDDEIDVEKVDKPFPGWTRSDESEAPKTAKTSKAPKASKTSKASTRPAPTAVDFIDPDSED